MQNDYGALVVHRPPFNCLPYVIWRIIHYRKNGITRNTTGHGVGVMHKFANLFSVSDSEHANPERVGFLQVRGALPKEKKVIKKLQTKKDGDGKSSLRGR